MSSASKLVTAVDPLAQYPKDVELRTFKGGCFCSKFAFELDHPPLEVKKPVSCNCTLCTKSGFIMVHARDKYFRLVGGSKSWDDLSKEESRAKCAVRYFCPTCGNQLFWKGQGYVGVNIRMLDDIHLEDISIVPFDGRNW